MTDHNSELTQWDAYDLLPAPLRKAFQASKKARNEFEVLRHFRELSKTRTEDKAVEEVLEWMEKPVEAESEQRVQYTCGSYRPGNSRPRERQLRTLQGIKK